MRNTSSSFGIALLTAVFLFSACGGSHTHRQPVMETQGHSPAHSPVIRVDEAIAELRTMQTPSGADAVVFSALKAELERQLLMRASQKITCAPPTGESGQVDDLTITGEGRSNRLMWHYRNNGDYNQDGIVGVADITPIAVSYGDAVPVGDENCLLAVVDGSGNDAIDISDITPIAMNFGASVAGYSVGSSDSEAGPFSPANLIPFSSAVGEGRLEFSIVLGITTPCYFNVSPYDAIGRIGEGSNLTASGYSPPVVHSIMPTKLHEYESVRFYAGVSSELPVASSWDFGGGAIPNVITDDSPTVTVSGPGEYNGVLTVNSLSGRFVFPFTFTVSEPAQYEWNFATYMGGDNNLSAEAFVDIQEMEQVGSTSKVAVNVQAEMYYEWGYMSDVINRFLVVHDTDNNTIKLDGNIANEQFPRNNFDSASMPALADYLSWSQEHFDASKHALTLWDHGAGWYNFKAIDGIISDDTSGSFLADYEVASVLANTGVYWDVLNMDACEMGSLEVAYEYRNVAHYLVFSQLSIPGQGEPYMPIAQALTATPSMDGASLAQAIQDAYISHYNANQAFADPGVCMSVVDLTKTNDVISALNDLAQLVLDNTETERTPFTAAASLSQSPTYMSDVDILDFLQRYRAATADEQIKAAIDALLDALDEFIVSEDAVSVSTDYSGLSGLSLWAPDGQYYTLYESEYRTTNFSKDTKWRMMLAALLQSPVTMMPADFRVELTWDTDADIDLYLLEPDQWETSGEGLHSPWWGGSPNGVFSEDSAYSDMSKETWTSNASVMAGKYTFLAAYYGQGNIFDFGTATMKVYQDDVLVIDESVYMDDYSPVDLIYGMGWHRFGSITLEAGI